MVVDLAFVDLGQSQRYLSQKSISKPLTNKISAPKILKKYEYPAHNITLDNVEFSIINCI